ncbi:hypothetical protein [Erwinia piriflorinigrans]|uniref:hypothetical protein n=1 Tax=Erwinia piriflorinigrans TaxID=665097 RepID=UPI000660C6A5|nr:hypothetical protein [Erwinia piriflorinigrans]
MPDDLICSGKERPEKPLYAGTEQREEISVYAVFFFWITMSSIYQVNLLNAMKIVFNVTMPMDARDTFFCHDTYMRSRLLKKAIYIKVSDSDYRVALPYNFEYQFLRLRCLESPPYYAIIPVEDADNLKYSQIRRGFYNLITDLDALYLKSSDKRMR